MPRDGVGLAGHGVRRRTGRWRRGVELVALAVVGMVVLAGCYSQLTPTPTPPHLPAGASGAAPTPAQLPTKTVAQSQPPNQTKNQQSAGGGGGGGNASPTPKGIGGLPTRTPTKTTIPTAKVGQLPAKPSPTVASTPTKTGGLNGIPVLPTNPTMTPTVTPPSIRMPTSTSTVTASSAGAVLILKSDPQGTPAPGACFELRGPQSYPPVCDNGQGDGDQQQGRILIQDVVPGQYTLSETTAPQGFQAAQPSQITVQAGTTVSVQVQDAPSSGGLTILKRDENGTAVPGACFSVINAIGTPTSACDSQGTGQVAVSNLEPGNVTVHEDKPPDGFAAAPDQTASVPAGGTAEVTFVDAKSAGSLKITKVDQDGNPLPGACFALSGPGNIGPVCDNQAGDADTADAGVILIQNIPPGDYQLHEATAPDGYQPAADQQVSVAGGAPTTIKVTDAKAAAANVPLASTVAFADSSNRLWILKPNDSAPRQVDADAPFDPSGLPALAPILTSDQQSLIYPSQVNGQVALVRYGVADQSKSQLNLGEAGTPIAMTLEPGAQVAAVTVQTANGFDVILTPLDGSPGTAIFAHLAAAPSASPEAAPAGPSLPTAIGKIQWAASGGLVAIQATNADGSQDVTVVDARNPSALNSVKVGLNNAAGSTRLIGWNPTDSRMLIVSNGQLAVADPTKQQPAQVIAQSVFTDAPYQPRWSADGSHVAYFDGDPHNGGGLNITDFTNGCGPIKNVVAMAWKPNGNDLAIAVNDPNNGPSVQLVTPNGNGCTARQTPQQVAADKLTWAPDGQSLVAVGPADGSGNRTLTVLSADLQQVKQVGAGSVAIHDTLGWIQDANGEALVLVADDDFNAPPADVWLLPEGGTTLATVAGSKVDDAGSVTGVWGPPTPTP